MQVQISQVHWSEGVVIGLNGSDRSMRDSLSTSVLIRLTAEGPELAPELALLGCDLIEDDLSSLGVFRGEIGLFVKLCCVEVAADTGLGFDSCDALGAG